MSSSALNWFPAYAFGMPPANETAREAFARRLNDLLQEQEKIWGILPNAELARRLKMSKSKLHQWRNGQTAHPDYAMAKEVAKALRANVDWLLKEEGPKRSGTTPTADRATLVGVEAMNLQQQQNYVVQLFEKIPHTARVKVLQDLLRLALSNGWIDAIPDAALAQWAATDKIRQLQQATKNDTD